MTTFTWTYLNGVCLPTQDGLTNILQVVNYQCVGTNGAISATKKGQVKLPNPDPNNYVEFENLTYAVVDTWAKAVLTAEGVTKIEAQLQARIQEQQDAIANPVAPTEPIVPITVALPF